MSVVPVKTTAVRPCAVSQAHRRCMPSSQAADPPSRAPSHRWQSSRFKSCLRSARG
jgi:hypothetical protein